MFHGHIITIEAEGDTDAFMDLIHIIKAQASYMLDNVIVKSVVDRDNSAEAMDQTARLVFPDGSLEWDNNGQVIVHTGFSIVTSGENPSTPPGSSSVVLYSE